MPVSSGGISLAVVDSDQAVREYLAGLFDGQSRYRRVLGRDRDPPRSAPDRGRPRTVMCRNCPSGHHRGMEPRSQSRRDGLVTAELSTDLLQKALRSGVKDVLNAPIDQDHLIETVQRIG